MLGFQSHVTFLLRRLEGHVTSHPALVGRWGAPRKANALLGVELCGGQREAWTRPDLLVKCHTPTSHCSLPVIATLSSNLRAGCFEEQGSAGVAWSHGDPRAQSVPDHPWITGCATWSSCHHVGNIAAALAGSGVTAACAAGWGGGGGGGSGRRR